MKKKKQFLKRTGTALLGVTGAFALILGGALTFNSLAETAAAAEMKGEEWIPTAYTIPVIQTVQTIPEGYRKADYMVVDDSLPYYADKKPGAKDMSSEEAAEIGAQFIWKFFGKELEGATIYMGFDVLNHAVPRTCWSGDVRFGSERTPQNPGYSFLIDAVTGELFSIGRSRTLSETVELGSDRALSKDPSEYINLAKTLAEEKNLLNGEVADCRYNSQGYSNNDPAITIDVTGENGESAIITFSRYDKSLQGIAMGVLLEDNVNVEESMQEEASMEAE